MPAVTTTEQGEQCGTTPNEQETCDGQPCALVARERELRRSRPGRRALDLCSIGVMFVAIVAGDMTPPTAAPEVGAGATGASELAFTGSATPWLAAVGSLLVAGGAALLVVARRRERLGFGA